MTRDIFDGNMSSYSVGGHSEAYGSVTRVVIASSASTLGERVQHASAAERWRTSANRQPGNLTLPSTSRHDDDPWSPTTTRRLLHGGDGRPTAARKDVGTVEVPTRKQQRRSRPKQVDERQRATLAASNSLAQHVVTERQLINMVTL